jgi:hypothetical protein
MHPSLSHSLTPAESIQCPPDDTTFETRPFLRYDLFLRLREKIFSEEFYKRPQTQVSVALPTLIGYQIQVRDSEAAGKAASRPFARRLVIARNLGHDEFCI